MRKFEGYPIYVNHPGRWETERKRQLYQFGEKGDERMVDWLTWTGRRLYEIIPDSPPTPESQVWEGEVVKLLRWIVATKVGKALFDALDPQQRYWIIPLFDEAECECGGAYTFPGHPKEGGGIRVYFNPLGASARKEKRWLTADDVLFHELVHAYRMGSAGYDVVNAAKPVHDNRDAEEFLALQLENMYLAQRGNTRLYRSYNSLQPVSKDSAYQYLASNADALMALRHWVEHDELVTKVSRWTNPPQSYNPFRDVRVLERILLRGIPDVARLPAF
jgi:hypothetical protein